MLQMSCALTRKFITIATDLYLTGNNERMCTWNSFIIPDYIAACRILELTLLVVFWANPCKSKAVRALDCRFIIIINIYILTRNCHTLVEKCRNTKY